jgi:FKBP-type peptidyl-prolyl cis-trans isomerase FkpA
MMLGFALGAVALGCQAKAPEVPPAAGPLLKTEEDKTVYALGVTVGSRLAGSFKLTPAELEVLKKGIGDGGRGGKPEVEIDVYGPKIEALARTRTASSGEAFRAAAAKEPGAIKTSSGLIYRTLSPGQGKSPSATDVVRVHYEGTFVDGTVFDSSIKRGQPVEFPLSGVIPCWTEGVQRMKVGEKARLVCPAEIAYGEQGQAPAIPGGATLIFEVQLLGIKGK